MKDIFLKNIATSSEANSSLPFILKLSQYSNSAANGTTSLIKQLKDNKIYNGAGNFGAGNFDVSIDCRHRSITEEVPSMQYINNIMFNHIQPSFSKKLLFEKFFIIEIPDYGQQAMSPFYRDFVPQVFVNNKKIWQKYIGMIKYYPQKVCYILIDREYGKTINLKDGSNIPNIFIRICFKNNIEKNETDSIDLTSVDNGLTFTAAVPVYTNGSFFENFNSLQDFAFKTSDGDFINPVLIESLSFKKNINTVPDIARETDNDTEINNSSEKIINDYFKQQYLKNYLDDNSHKDDYKREDVDGNITMIVKFKKAIKKSLSCCSKNNYYDSEYIIYDNSTESKFQANDILIFEPSGTYKNSEELVSSTTYEIIHEYNYKRRILVKRISTTSTPILEVGRYINRLYLDSPLILGFDNNGNLKQEASYTSNLKTLIIYDNEEDELINNNKYTQDPNLKFVFSSDDMILDSKFISFSANESFTFKSTNMRKFNFSNSEIIPASFYINGLPSNLDLYMVSGLIPFKLEKIIYDNNVLYFRIPDKFRLGSSSQASLLLNSLQPVIYFNKQVALSSIEIFNIEHLNDDFATTNDNDTNKNKSFNSNVVNHYKANRFKN